MKSKLLKNPFSKLEGDVDEGGLEEKPVDLTKNIPSDPKLQTLNQKLLLQLRTPPKTLNDLAKAIGSAFGAHNFQKIAFIKHYDNYDLIPVDEYAQELRGQLLFLPEFDNNDFVQMVLSYAEPFKPFDLRELISNIFTSSMKKGISRGNLLLICLLVSQNPGLISQDLFNFQPNELVVFAPIIFQILLKALSGEIRGISPPMSQRIIDIFLPSMRNVDQIYASMAVCASHLISEAFEKEGVFNISAASFSCLLLLVNRSETHRDTHISAVLRDLVEHKLKVEDEENLAASLAADFPSPLPFVSELFIKKVLADPKGKFAAGWLSLHQQNKQASMDYLRQTIEELPDAFVFGIPRDDILKCGDKALAVANKLRLARISTRFTVILGIACVVAYLQMYYRIL